MTATGILIFLNNSPSDRCDQIVWMIKNSDLNYCVQETSFSLNIQLKKKFVVKWETNQSTTQSLGQPTAYSNIANKGTLSNELEVEVNKIKAENAVSRDTIRTLEIKLVKAESNLSKSCKDKEALTKAIETDMDTCKDLRKAIKNLHSDAASMVQETDLAYKALKSKDKEIYNLEKKTNNQQETIERLRDRQTY